MAVRTAILTDSTADIPPALAQERHIYVVPMQIIWQGETLRDGIDIDAQQFYRRLATTRELPTTSQPAPSTLAEAYRRARDETGAEGVIMLTISARLSGSYNAALEATKMVDFPAHAVDTRTGSIAHGLVALALADARDEGIAPGDAFELAQQLAARTKMIFALDTLEYLHRSGRIDNLRRLIGTALRIKPILHVKDGGIALLEQVRTRKHMLRRLSEIFDEAVDRTRPLRVGVLHGNALEDMQMLVEKIRARWSPLQLVEGTVGVSVGVHTGPGSLGFGILQ